MNTSDWEARLKALVQKASEDIKRSGAEVMAEAEKLLKEAQDPARHQQVKDGLKNFGAWAKKTAEDVANAVASTVSTDGKPTDSGTSAKGPDKGPTQKPS